MVSGLDVLSCLEVSIPLLEWLFDLWLQRSAPPKADVSAAAGAAESMARFPHLGGASTPTALHQASILVQRLHSVTSASSSLPADSADLLLNSVLQLGGKLALVNGRRQSALKTAYESLLAAMTRVANVLHSPTAATLPLPSTKLLIASINPLPPGSKNESIPTESKSRVEGTVTLDETAFLALMTAAVHRGSITEMEDSTCAHQLCTRGT